MAAIAQTIAIVDRSGKVVSSHKQLKNVFVEAKLAYQERKAEIKAERKQKEERELQKAIKAMSVADIEERSEVSRAQRRAEYAQRRRRSSEDRTQLQGDYRETPYATGSNSPRSPYGSPNLAQFNQDLYGASYDTPGLTQSASGSPIHETPALGQLLRRSNTDTMQLQFQQRPGQTRSYSATDIDLDLAYGEFHEPDLAHQPAMPEKELSGLVKKCQTLLDEAQCAGSSVKAIITHLQTNPDAMAAVALTLAEISNIASKMAPGALTAFKTSAPAVIALLAAPEFLIAVGVGVGITVVMFGGYQIIKKIKRKQLNDSSENVARGIAGNDNGAEEMIDVKQLSRIEQWRRGINEGDLEETRSVVSGYSATSVEGEFITPFAQRSMGHLPLPAKYSSRSNKVESSSKKGNSGDKERKKKKVRKDSKNSGSSASEADSDTGSQGSARDKQVIKVKKPSPLRRMFTAPSSTRS